MFDYEKIYNDKQYDRAKEPSEKYLYVPLLSGRVKQVYLLVLTAVAFLAALNLSEGTYWTNESLSTRPKMRSWPRKADFMVQ